jgi:phosphoadenosine phosphosulfate reductase
MAFFKNNVFSSDPWRYLERGDALPSEGRVILASPDWRARRGDLAQTNAPLGLRLEPGEDIAALAGDLARFAVVAVNFPKFSDGRGYSIAHRLRVDAGFAGELRAIGEILFDQIPLLTRAGFDAFEINDPATLRLIESGRRPGFGLHYQPGFGVEIKEQTRPWARRAFG